MLKKKLRWKYLKINVKIKFENLNFSFFFGWIGHPMGAEIRLESYHECSSVFGWKSHLSFFILLSILHMHPYKIIYSRVL